MKELERLTKQAKIDLLRMFETDADSYKLAKEICLKYLNIYPSEKKFKVRVYNQIKDYKWRYGSPWASKLAKKSVDYSKVDLEPEEEN